MTLPSTSSTTPSRLVLGIILMLSAVSLAGFIALLAYPLDTTYKLSAHTERAAFRSDTELPSRWALRDVDLYQVDPYQNTPTPPVRFTGMIDLDDSVSVDIRRIAYGPLFIRIEAYNQSGSVGWLYTELGRLHPLGRAQSVVEITINDLPARADTGATVALPIFGDVTVGRVFGHTSVGSEGFLQSGTVTMTGRSLIRGDVFEAGRAYLDMGDQFFLTGAQTPAIGFIVADHRPAFTIAYRAAAKAGRVVRPGSDTGYAVSASLLEQVTHDRVFQGVSLLFGVLTVLSTLLVGGTRLLDALRTRFHPAGPSREIPESPTEASPPDNAPSNASTSASRDPEPDVADALEDTAAAPKRNDASIVASDTSISSPAPPATDVPQTSP